MGYKFKTKPTDYQLEALKRAVKAKRFGVFFQQRVGKTKVALDFAAYLHNQGKAHKVLVVCPVAARLNWIEQMSVHVPGAYRAELLPEKGRAWWVKANKDTGGELVFLLVTWDLLRREWETLAKWAPDILIADELHRARHHTSKQSRALQKLSRRVEYFLGLTGTPVAHSPLNVFGEFLCIDPSIFGTRWQDFQDRYAIMGGYMGYKNIGYKNLEELSDKMAQASIRVLRRDVLAEPDVEHVNLPVPLEPGARKLYDEFRKESITDLGNGSTITANFATTKFLRLRQLTGGWAKGDDGNDVRVSSAKLNAAVEFIDDHVRLGGEKLAVVAYFKHDIADLVEAVQGLGLTALVIDGTTGEAARQANRKLFNESPTHNVIVLQEGAASEAVSFAAARQMLFYSLDLALDKYLQIRDRIMGREQTADSVSYYYLVAQKTIDERIVKGLQKGENLAATIQDKWRWLLEEGP